MLSSEVSLALQLACFALAAVHGWCFPKRSGLLIGVFWGSLAALALLFADGQGAFLGFIGFPLFCWLMSAIGAAARELFLPPKPDSN
jgi:hypothetical protein